MSDLDNLLDATLDDLEDLPSFTPFPRGAHRVLASFEEKEINGAQCVELNLTMIETIEYSDPLTAEELAKGKGTKEGDTCNTMYQLANKYGSGHFKAAAAVFGEHLGLTSLRDIVDQVTDIECIVITSLRPDKNDKDKFYLDVKEIEVV